VGRNFPCPLAVTQRSALPLKAPSLAAAAAGLSLDANGWPVKGLLEGEAALIRLGVDRRSELFFQAALGAPPKYLNWAGHSLCGLFRGRNRINLPPDSLGPLNCSGNQPLLPADQ
jgi:hypothetical protein